MFGRGNGAGVGSESDPQQQEPQVPPMRLFRVRRYSPLDTGYERLVEEITLEAHTVAFNGAGNVLQFGVCVIDPWRGPTEFIRRCFNGWIDYEEELRYQPSSGVIVQ